MTSLCLALYPPSIWSHLSISNPLSTPWLPPPFPARNPYTPTCCVPGPHAQCHKPSTCTHPSRPTLLQIAIPVPCPLTHIFSAQAGPALTTCPHPSLHLYTLFQDKRPSSLPSTLLNIFHTQFLMATPTTDSITSGYLPY